MILSGMPKRFTAASMMAAAFPDSRRAAVPTAWMVWTPYPPASRAKSSNASTALATPDLSSAPLSSMWLIRFRFTRCWATISMPPPGLTCITTARADPDPRSIIAVYFGAASPEAGRLFATFSQSGASAKIMPVSERGTGCSVSWSLITAIAPMPARRRSPIPTVRCRLHRG